MFFCLLAVPAGAETLVRDVRLGLQDGGGTRFVLELDQPADFNLFVLDNPKRLVIDLPPVSWSPSLSPVGKGVVTGWRHGQFGQGTRVVLDLNSAVKVTGTQDLPARDGHGPRLVVDLAPTGQGEFGAQIGRIWGERAIQDQAMVSASAPGERTADGYCPRPPALPLIRRTAVARPLIVIDPGHGGVDPGTHASNGRVEKDLTLAIARQLASRLESSGHYRVVLTRSRDVFVPLQGRVKIARDANADLFISLHADSVRDRSIRGATVYTLSDRATDREAAELAESENRADELAGLPGAGSDNTLADILTAMSYRASVNGGRDLSDILVNNLRDVGIMLNNQPQRSAGFAVLKAPDIPSVLIEMGYLTSRSDAELMASTAHQRKLAGAIATAVDSFFIRHRPATEALAVLTEQP